MSTSDSPLKVGLVYDLVIHPSCHVAWLIWVDFVTMVTGRNNSSLTTVVLFPRIINGKVTTFIPSFLMISSD